MILLSEVNSAEINPHLAVCKSNSGVVGERLRKAHHELGRAMGEQIVQDMNSNSTKDFTVLCLMRSGLCFGMGIADELDCTLLLLDEKNDPQWLTSDPLYSNRFIAGNFSHLKNKSIILVDAVLNTGKSMFSVLNQIEPFANDTIIAVNVVQEKMIDVLKDKKAYAIRSSKNQFIGANVTHQRDGKGPDTGDRLFKTILSE